MLKNKLFAVSFAACALVVFPAFSQDEGGRSDVTVQALGSFGTTTTHNGIDNSQSKSGGVLGTYRYFFSRHHGIEASYGYAENTQRYESAGGSTGIKTRSHELSGAYVYRMPLHKVTPFALAGAGALFFDPKDYRNATTTTRAAFVYGAGADFSLTHHIFMRAEYRGFVYNSPTYGLAALSGVDRVTHRAEPSVGFGYRF